jgi:multidrug resistance efflux pump
MDTDQTTAWLPLAEAARRLGVTVDSLRKRASRGLVEHRKGNDGRIVVLVDGETAASQWLADPDELAEARAEAERWRALAEQRGIDLARAEERATAAARVAEAEVKAARDQLDRELARVARLEEELRELRRPWWRRFVGK